MGGVSHYGSSVVFYLLHVRHTSMALLTFFCFSFTGFRISSFLYFFDLACLLSLYFTGPSLFHSTVSSYSFPVLTSSVVRCLNISLTSPSTLVGWEFSSLFLYKNTVLSCATLCCPLNRTVNSIQGLIFWEM